MCLLAQFAFLCPPRSFLQSVNREDGQPWALVCLGKPQSSQAAGGLALLCHPLGSIPQKAGISKEWFSVG